MEFESRSGGGMKILVGFFLLVFLIGGCESQMAWVHPSKTRDQARKDMDECWDIADRNVFVPLKGAGSFASAATQQKLRKEKTYEGCMASRGYSSVDKQVLDDERKDLEQSGQDLQAASKNNDFAKALEISNNVIAQHPHAPHGYLGRANVYFLSGKWYAAMMDMNKALSMKMDAKSTAHAHMIRVLCLLKLSNLDGALAAIDEGMKATPSNSALHDLKAQVFNMKGAYDKALEECDRALALDSSKPSPYCTKGSAYVGKGEFEKAIKQFNKAITVDPSYKHAYHSRGETFLRREERASALTDFKEACRLNHEPSCSMVRRLSAAK